MGRFAKVRQRLLAAVLTADLWVLRICVASARPAVGRRLAVALSRNRQRRPLSGSGGPVGSAVGRARPRRDDRRRDQRRARAQPLSGDQAARGTAPALSGARRSRALLETLDEHSFPSGHVMTLTAALVPIVLALPATLPLSLGAWCAMAWARLASAHHYPSDIFAGAGIALVVSYPLSRYGLLGVLPG